MDIRGQVEREMARLNKILALLNEEDGVPKRRGRKPGKKSGGMSAEGRRAVSRAQKKRWAKVKRAKKEKKAKKENTAAAAQESKK